MSSANTSTQTHTTQYSIAQDAQVLGNIYDHNHALSCFCNPANWALSRAAKSIANKTPGELLRFQGEIGTELQQLIQETFSSMPHADMITDYVEMMLDMFELLFEPKEIGIRILSSDHSHSPAFHQNRMIARMACTLGGAGERWITHQDAIFHPLEKNQFVREITPASPNVISHFCDGDIALYKGINWQDHEEHALITASPEFSGNDARLSIYIDLLE